MSVPLMIFLLSACNLNSTPDEQIEPLATDTSTPQPSPTFTLTPLPIVPASATPINAQPTLIPLTTQGSENVAPVGVQSNPTANVGSTGGNTGQSASGTPEGTPSVPFPETFPDRYTATVGTGRTLLVNYLVELREAGVGRVFFVVRDPNGDEVARWLVTESVDDTEEIPAEVGGEYEVLVAFENLRGYYSVSFDTR